MAAQVVQYVQKPAEIEVVVVGDNALDKADVVAWLDNELGEDGDARVTGMGLFMFNSTINGVSTGMTAYAGSRIVKDSRGQIYVMTQEQLDLFYYTAE